MQIRSGKLLIVLLLLQLAVLPIQLFGQKAEKMKAAESQDHRLQSKAMGREMPYRVLLPLSYKKKKAQRYPVLYLLHGLTGHFNNWSDKTKVAQYLAAYEIIIVMPEGGDGWYTDSVSSSFERHETYLVEDLIPEVEQKFRTANTRGGRAIAGFSMGGYGAVKFGLKHPGKFSLVGSFSGALDAAIRGQGHPFLRPSIMAVFGPEGSQARKDNDVFGLVAGLSEEKKSELPYIYLACGNEDFLFKANLELAGRLHEKKIPHEVHLLPGSHNWAFWDSQIAEFLRLADQRLSK